MIFRFCLLIGMGVSFGWWMHSTAAGLFVLFTFVMVGEVFGRR